jgi:lysyl-tRNA synthetase class 2
MADNTAKKTQDASSGITDPRAARKAKKDAMVEAGVNPYAYTFDRTHKAGEMQDKYADLESGVETEDFVQAAGRIMAMRNNGMFIDMMDTSGRIQVFCHKDSMDEEQLAKLKSYDLGDIIGVKGTIRRTPRGELSIRAKETQILTKSMEPLPEKYHGLSDVEQRYRQRYIDLIVNEDSRDVLRKRSQIVSEIRRYLSDEWEGVEVETPMLHGIMGGASAKPFVTHHNALDANFYLRVAPELHLKRLIVGGLADCVFEINRCFRNEGISMKHNPEFTSVELYKAFSDYHDMMDMTEGLVQHVAEKVLGTTKIDYQGTEIDLASPWPRKTMLGLVEEKTGVNFLDYTDVDAAREKAKELGVHTEEFMNWGQIVAEVFDEKVEDSLIQPIHITELPLDISPLAKNHRDNPLLTERFETYINGWEIANAFTELNDPEEQRKRFEAQVEAKEAGDEEAQMLDEDFVTALAVGLPPTGGWGLGIDRLCMIMTNSTNIRDVINFPTLKPEKKMKDAVKPAAPVASAPEAQSACEAVSHTDIDENEYRFIMVINGKEESAGRLFNATGHAMAGLVAQAVKTQPLHFVDYMDKDGDVHPNISHFPVIALKAKNSNQVAKVREAAKSKGIVFTDFTDTMAVGTTQQQLDATKAASGEELNYLGMCLFGKTSELKEITGKLSLYK